MLLEAVARREVKSSLPALCVQARQRSVIGTAIQANDERCHAGTPSTARGMPVRVVRQASSAACRRAEARSPVRANICVQRTAGRVAAIGFSAALAGRR